MDTLTPQGKPLAISKWQVWEAYRWVKANQGAPGVDECSLEDFEQDLRGNRYKTWNRLASGSYFPPPVKAVAVPKPHGGGTRTLGCPRSRTASPRRWSRVGWRARWNQSLPSGLLRLPAGPVGPGRGGGVPAARLDQGLGARP
jgi:hypothetical protein